jgi:hypothetical protein
MKKLVVLITVLALMAIALPVMASDVTLTGTATYGAVVGQNAAGDTVVADGMGDSVVHIAGKVDANNTVNVELWGDGLIPAALAGTAAASPVGFGSFYLQSDIGGALSLGSVDPVLYAGYSTATLPGYSVTGYGKENIAGLGVGGEGAGLAPSENGAAQALLAVDTSVNKMFNILVGVNPETLAKNAAKQFVLGAYGTVGPVSAEVGFVGNGGAKAADGAVALGALADYTVSNIELKGTAQMVYDMSTAQKSSYSAGVSATYNKMVTAAGSLVGTFGATSGMSNATVEVDLMPITNASINVGALMNLQSGAANAFDSLDASGSYSIGATKVTLGYIYSPASATQATLNGTGPSGWNAPASGQNGVYVKASLAF